jgi:hypothetical protein
MAFERSSLQRRLPKTSGLTGMMRGGLARKGNQRRRSKEKEQRRVKGAQKGKGKLSMWRWTTHLNRRPTTHQMSPPLLSLLSRHLKRARLRIRRIMRGNLSRPVGVLLEYPQNAPRYSLSRKQAVLAFHIEKKGPCGLSQPNSRQVVKAARKTVKMRFSQSQSTNMPCRPRIIQTSSKARRPSVFLERDVWALNSFLATSRWLLPRCILVVLLLVMSSLKIDSATSKICRRTTTIGTF